MDSPRLGDGPSGAGAGVAALPDDSADMVGGGSRFEMCWRARQGMMGSREVVG